MKRKPEMTQVVMEFDQAEVMLILLEELGGNARPPGLSATQALLGAMIRGKTPQDVDRMRGALERASARIIDYMSAEMARQLPGGYLVRLSEGPERVQ